MLTTEGQHRTHTQSAQSGMQGELGQLSISLALMIGFGLFPDFSASLRSSVTLTASVFDIQTAQESRKTGVSVVHQPTSISQSVMRNFHYFLRQFDCDKPSPRRQELTSAVQVKSISFKTVLQLAT